MEGVERLLPYLALVISPIRGKISITLIAPGIYPVFRSRLQYNGRLRDWREFNSKEADLGVSEQNPLNVQRYQR